MSCDVVRISVGESAYPARLSRLMGKRAPTSLTLCGNARLLHQPLLALLVSQRCPGAILLEAFDTVRSIRSGDCSVVGGFHSPMEQQCLESLLLQQVGVVAVLPRPIAGMRMPAEWRGPLDQGRLLVLSPFPEGNRRSTRERAKLRNVTVAALADALFIPYAAEQGSVERCVALALEWGTPVLSVGANAQPLLKGRAGRVEAWIAGRSPHREERAFALT